MSAVETLQQANMFTGNWETKRTRSPLQQMSMFSPRDTVQIGVSARPWLSQLPRPTLELIREDVRTPEEIERGLMLEAAAITSPMFASEALPESEDEPEQEGLDSGNDKAQPENLPDGEKTTKLSSYHALVSLAHEQAVTLWVDGAYRQRYLSQLPLSIQVASGAGLTASEISAAMQIGEFLGTRERQSAGQNSRVIYDASRGNETPPAEAATSEPAPPTPPPRLPPAIRDDASQEGLRARWRRERVPVRTRQPKPTAPESTPLYWMEREHIQKRLPYLAEGIARLDEDELTLLAESISQVLQETYWTILGITLAHYLDHEQGEQRERRERTA